MNKINAVFIPGLLNDNRLWHKVIESLSDIIVPYHGDITSKDNMTDLANNVLANAPEKFILIGLSMGGYVALEIMQQAPERVLGLALFNTNARSDTPEASVNRRKAIEIANNNFNEVIDDFLPKIVLHQNLDNIEIVQKIRSMAQAVGINGFKLQQTAIINRKDQRPNLQKIQCPTLIACGKEDELTPVDMHQEMQELIPNSSLEVIKNCAHLSAIECPFEVSKILRQWINTNFLASKTFSQNNQTIDITSSNDMNNINNSNLMDKDFSNANNNNNSNPNYNSNQNPNSISSHKNNYNMQTHEYGNSRNSDITNNYKTTKEVVEEEK